MRIAAPAADVATPAEAPLPALRTLDAPPLDAAGAADGDAPPAVALTLADALAAAERAPGIAVAKAAESVAAAAIAVAGARPGPSLTLGTHSITARESVSASTPFRWLGQRKAAVAAAKADLGTATGQSASAVAMARHEVRLAWVELRAAATKRQLEGAIAERLERTAAAVGDMVTSGRSPRLDEVRARAEAAMARADVESARQDELAASEALAALLARPSSPPLAAADPDPAIMSPQEAAARVSVAASASGEVAITERQVAAAEAGVVLARAGGRPDLGLDVGADLDDPTQPGTDAWAAVTLGLHPDGRPRVKAAQAELARAQADLARARREAASGAAAAARRLLAARARLAALDTSALPASREAAELSELSHREGRSDLFRLLDAERALKEVEAQRADAWLEAQRADADLRWLSGEGPP